MVLRPKPRESRSLPGLRRTEVDPAITMKRKRRESPRGVFVFLHPLFEGGSIKSRSDFSGRGARTLRTLDSAEKIQLADIDPLVAQQAVGRRHVEIEVRQHEAREIEAAREFEHPIGDLHLDLARL